MSLFFFHFAKHLVLLIIKDTARLKLVEFIPRIIITLLALGLAYVSRSLTVVTVTFFVILFEMLQLAAHSDFPATGFAFDLLLYFTYTIHTMIGEKREKKEITMQINRFEQACAQLWQYTKQLEQEKMQILH
ncbi:hypothetical protein B5807_10593 [Epicoccum nigrum]|jgi:hypothetical protein|uniref:Uncharacterized protein n=1 Tax=Epicoccum nigrum TaxID=105696 RepID=A0A1Y2LLP3_EPING|nr:hypothetical protein B5807_10593 [Epicoccum nigrum]